jgi:hypothetical protein
VIIHQQAQAMPGELIQVIVSLVRQMYIVEVRVITLVIEDLAAVAAVIVLIVLLAQVLNLPIPVHPLPAVVMEVANTEDLRLHPHRILQDQAQDILQAAVGQVRAQAQVIHRVIQVAVDQAIPQVVLLVQVLPEEGGNNLNITYL